MRYYSEMWEYGGCRSFLKLEFSGFPLYSQLENKNNAALDGKFLKVLPPICWPVISLELFTKLNGNLFYYPPSKLIPFVRLVRNWLE
ncbi:hypothetical protein A4A49_21171 [Nicotiana attenuata]|uniref:Uncharacterized protein n=1 Tax=Nicotiana attenuata TaxID=49451 RepID=A0A1J6IHK3_NICAT|nr:hypothetical protein A4A49_21171 [Nicotiana attenuata]